MATRDEIKQSVSMRQVVESYGIRLNSNNMCSCPFHGDDKHPSAKVDSRFHCFTCGADHDIFSFKATIEGVDFRTAFQMLGGSYGLITPKQRAMIRKADLERARMAAEERTWREKVLASGNKINICLEELERIMKPFVYGGQQVFFPEMWLHWQTKLIDERLVLAALEEEGGEKGWSLSD